MFLWNHFVLHDHTIWAYLPDTDEVPCVWTLRVTKGAKGATIGDELVHEQTIPLDYAPRFGPDVSDVQNLNAVVEAMIRDLKLEPDGIAP